MTEALACHSPYFEALFAHPFTEARTRIVELNLPCIEMLEATLFHPYTGKEPPMSLVNPDSVRPDDFFGLLANAKFLMLEKLKDQCADI